MKDKSSTFLGDGQRVIQYIGNDIDCEKETLNLND